MLSTSERREQRSSMAWMKSWYSEAELLDFRLFGVGEGAEVEEEGLGFAGGKGFADLPLEMAEELVKFLDRVAVIGVRHRG
ncbi:hypothetical protein ACLB2K_029684 [Fragaria x ananassa]